MLILVSPAKTLDYDSPLATAEFSLPDFIVHSTRLIETCRQLTPADIASLMKVSDKIAGLNAARFEQWQPQMTTENARQAILAFKGDVYTGLDAQSFTAADFTYAQQHLRILSGLYGLLKPLDLMQPYRLEMGTRLVNERGTNLYQFWGELLTDAVNQACATQQSEWVVNLASNEYFKALKPKLLTANLITPVFKDCKKGQYKVISFYAKKARGMMARFIIQNQVDSVEKLTEFNDAGYAYCAQESSAEQLVFKREEQ